MPRNDKENIKKLLQDWKTSKKYQEFRIKLEEQKKRLSTVLDAPKKVILSELSHIDPSDVILVIENTIDFAFLSEEQKLELAMPLITNITKENYYTELTKTIMAWYGYLYYFEKQEKYEICKKVQKVIQIEINEFKVNLKHFFELNEYDHIMIEEICDVCKSKFF